MAPVAERTRPTQAEYLANDIFCYVNYDALRQRALSRQRVMKESREFYKKKILEAIKPQKGEDILRYLESVYKDMSAAHIMQSFVHPFFAAHTSA